jgi:enoyl-CoA hydratase/carnithine racemase
VHELTLTEPDARGVAHLRFASGRPANTMILPMLLEWLDLTAALAARDDVRVLLLQGPAGTFSGGADLSRIADMDAETWRTYIETEFALFDAIDRLPFITIGVLDGHCLGNGAELALALDLRVASDRTKFGFPETRIGFQGPAQRLTRFVGIGTAKRLLYDGTVISTDEAQSLGLIDWVVPADELEEKAEAVARQFAELPPLAIRETKRNLAEAYPMPPDANEIASSLTTSVTEDALEGRTAFFEKRRPVFRGR